MLKRHWHMISGLEPKEFVSNFPKVSRWSPGKALIFDNQSLIVETLPHQVDEQGFSFVIASSQQIWVQCRGKLTPAGEKTKVECTVSTYWKSLAFGFWLMLGSSLFLLIAVWSIDPKLAAFCAVGLPFLAVLYAFAGIQINLLWCRRRVRRVFAEVGLIESGS